MKNCQLCYGSIFLLFMCCSSIACTNQNLRVDAVSYSPARAPELTGALEPNFKLQESTVIAKGKVSGPEEFTVDELGRIYFGSTDGLVQRLNLNGEVETFAVTGGHPLGMAFTASGDLIVAEPGQGLLSIDADGSVRVLSNEAEAIPFKLVDDVIVGSNGLIYFTDASAKFSLENFRYDILEAGGNGRLLVYDPVSEQTRVLARDLYFANGLTFSDDESYLLIVESSRYQIRRLWLQGPKQGQLEIFAENLPGFPDGISTGSDGNYWVAFFSVRSRQVDLIHPLAWLKNLLAKLPPWVLPEPERYGLVVKYDHDGQAIESLHDPEGVIAYGITSAVEIAGGLYLGNLSHDQILRYELN